MKKFKQVSDIRLVLLDVDVVFTGSKNKLPQLTKICQDYSVALINFAFCGDDVLDLPIITVCRLGVAPSDAHSLELDGADWVNRKSRVQGMVREFVDKLLCQQLKLPITDIYSKLMNDISQDNVSGIEQ